MGNHGGGIPPGGSASAGSKGVGAGAANGPTHGFSAGMHVHVTSGIHTGVSGRIKRTVGLNHVHIVPKAGRSVIAHVKSISHIPGPRVSVR
jgi:hypothetical protein